MNSLRMNISPAVHGHLINVYQTLAAMLGWAAVGSVVHSSSVIPGLSGGILSFIACLLCLVAFMMTTPTQENAQLRSTTLFALAFFKGLTIGPLIDAVSRVNPNTVWVAISATAVIFVCFTLSVLYSPRRQVFLTMGVLSSILGTLGWVSLINFFVRSPALFSMELYLGLVGFLVFVVYDTQVIIQKAENGSKDYQTHSLELFTDAVGIFVRILSILNKRQADRDNDDRRRRNKNR
ncbi:hypothetical protein BASA50_001385 [Batrachochytrium salamandrivorans]|uniref:Bax inhibitor 1 n=1 Tax=Batrachochytrium salamandrivorans TaxID=1357716 RepID=A0ABQ8EY40_9FUNG|nr:hypothetical protein BASA50_001385 [Batrachochytrium salamandrivorans]